MASAVCDAGPLIHLSEIGQIQLLGLFSPLWIPESVAKEASGVAFPSVATRVKVGAEERKAVAAKVRVLLQEGERDGLAVCAREPGVVFLTDDLAAREAAKRMGLAVHGSVGIILRGYRERLLTKRVAEQSLQNLQVTSSLFVTSAIIEMAIEELRKAK